jgi:hypothetical protein
MTTTTMTTMTTTPAATTPILEDVAAAVAVCVVDEPPHAALPRALGWAIEILGGGLDEVPLAAIHDVGFVLLRGRAVRLCGGRERVALDLEAVADDSGPLEARALVRRERLAWEERVVAPLLRDAAVMQAAVVVAGAPAERTDALIVHALRAILPRIVSSSLASTLSLPRTSPAALRPIVESPDLVLADDSADDAADDGGLAFAIDVGRAAVVDAARDLGDIARARVVEGGPPLLLADELWELSRLDQIPSEAMRLALRTVHRTMDGIGPVSPALIARLRDRRQDVVVDDVVADAFPAGGFDAMSTRGVLENLVRSEVGYVGVGSDVDAAGRPTGPDLFDVRFVEGELLYYTRDESPLLERRRQLVVLIDEVERLRHKLRELPSQTIVLVEAAVLLAWRDLQVACGPHVATLTVAVAGEDGDAVAEEQGLLRTSLHADLAHRRAALVDVAALPVPGRVTFSPRPAPVALSSTSTSKGPRRRGLWVRVGGPLWELSDGATMQTLDPTTGLRALVDRLMLMA